jgi:threonine dehydratase
MPEISTRSKIQGTRKFTDKVIFSGSTSQQREEMVREVRKRVAGEGDGEGPVLVPPYEHPDIILGQGTVGREMEVQFDEMQRVNHPENQDGGVGNGHDHDGVDGSATTKPFDAIIAPLGGGGLLGGIATYFSEPPTPSTTSASHPRSDGTSTTHTNGTKTRSHRPFIFGAEPSHGSADDARRGLAQGKRILTVSSLTIADGLRTPVGELNWTIVSDRRKVEGVYSITDAEIKMALRLVMERMKVFVEPSAVVGLGVVLFDQGFREWVAQLQGEEVEERRKKGEQGVEVRAWDVGLVFSGGNTTVEAVCKLFADEK